MPASNDNYQSDEAPAPWFVPLVVTLTAFAAAVGLGLWAGWQ